MDGDGDKLSSPRSSLVQNNSTRIKCDLFFWFSLAVCNSKTAASSLLKLTIFEESQLARLSSKFSSTAY